MIALSALKKLISKKMPEYLSDKKIQEMNSFDKIDGFFMKNKNKSNNELLHLAVEDNENPMNLRVAKFLIEEAKADVNSLCQNNKSLISKAMESLSNFCFVDYLLKNGAKVDGTTYFSLNDLSQNCKLVYKKVIIPKFLERIENLDSFNKQLPYIRNDSDIIEYFAKTDGKIEIAGKNLSADNAYYYFGEAKFTKNNFLVSYILQNFTKEVYTYIKNNKAQKENMSYFLENGIFFRYKYNGLELISQKNNQNEISYKHNTSDVKKLAKTSVYDKQLFDHEYKRISNEEKEYGCGVLYVVDKKCNLYVQNDPHKWLFHSFFLKGKEGQDLYGMGKPIASGGNIKIKNGKITYIDNSSGHYKPSFTNLKLVVKKLFEKGVFDNEAVIHDHALNINYNLSQIISENIESTAHELYDTTTDISIVGGNIN